MTYAVIGAGSVGRALASHFARKGIPVHVANSRGPESLTGVAGELGTHITPASVKEAVRADVVILAVPFGAVPKAMAGKIGRAHV